MIDTGLGVLGMDPLFNTRSTQQPTQGIVQIPALGMVDNLYKGARSFSQATIHGEGFDRENTKRVIGALNVFQNWPVITQMLNTGMNALPEAK
jgi:hypothetical protein